MLLRTNLYLGAAFALALSFPVVAQDEPSIETVVASVNGVDITLGHLALARNGLPDQYLQLPPQVLYDGLLDQMVQQILLMQTQDTLPTHVQMLLDNARRTAISNEALTEAVQAAITDEAIAEAYEAKYANVEPSTEFNASHILVETSEEAIAILEEANGGADFGDLAREHSTGPSGPNGGQLGWFGQGQMVPPFEEAVMAMDPGAVAGPVETQFGFHVIKLNEVRDILAPHLDDVRAEIVSDLERVEAERVVATLSDGADVTKTEGIDPAIISDPTLFDK